MLKIVQAQTDDLLSFENTKALRLLFAFMILAHHTYQQTLVFGEYKWFDYLLRYFGYFGVSAFFFLSGYGLQYSVESKPNYAKALLKKTAGFFMLNAFLVLLYAVVKSVVGGGNIELKDIILSLTFGHTIVGAGWYLQEIIVIYLLLFLCLKISKKHSTILFASSIFLLTIILFLLKFGTYWFISTLSVLSGLAVCKYKTHVLNVLKENFVLFYASMTLIFIALNFWNFQHPKMITLLGQNLLFPFVVVLPLYNKVVNMSSLLEKISSLTLEIFLLQGVVFVLLNSMPNINAIAYVLVAFIGTIILSYGMKPIFNYILH